MKSIFGPAGKRALRALARSSALYGFDFDGTLTPYFTDPHDVYTPKGVAQRMRQLCKRVSVAVITGRSLKSLRPRLGFVPRYQIGNHGMDGMTSARSILPRAKRISSEWAKHIRAAEAGGSYPQGVWMEDKVYSLTFHYRSSQNASLAKRSIARAVERLGPRPRIVLGKYVVNLLPPGVPHKGDALRELLRREGCRAALFVGDDVTDEDVFRRAPKSWVTVRVGKSRCSAARFYIPSFNDIPRFLDVLLEYSAGTE